MVEAERHPEAHVHVGIVGKYLDLADTYKSIEEALKHAGIKTRTRVHLDYIDAENLQDEGTQRLASLDAILVPGGFGTRGIEGKILAARFAREHKVPYFGICLGLQIAVIECARHNLGWKDANSTEFDRQTSHAVIALVDEVENAQASPEIWAEPCVLEPKNANCGQALWLRPFTAHR